LQTNGSFDYKQISNNSINTNNDNKYNDYIAEKPLKDTKDNYHDYKNKITRRDYEIEKGTISTESNYNPIKLNEVSNNNRRFQNFDNKKFISINNNEILDKSIEHKKFDVKSINNDVKLLDKLKNKIKDLESKIGEINNGNKLFIYYF